MALAPGARLGPYEIVGAIGAGGMGEVYRAKDTRLTREVAIKILPADLVDDPERRARFEREAQVVSALNHPNIVTLYEVGTSDVGPYLVLEKVDGQSLRDVLAGGPLPVRRLLALGAQIADGLAKAHSAGIVHRDLKPDNVMVTADGFAKILDFGLAKLVWPEWHAADAENDTTIARDTASGMILGTLGYLSPEQASGRPADERADQFALGALLYEMATRDRLFRRATMAESLAATIRDDAPPLRSKRDDVPPPFVWIVERCLAKNPIDRYASTRDLARDLADVRDRLSDLSQMSARPAVPETKRSRALMWASAAIFGGALLVGAFAIGRESATGGPPAFRQLTFQRGIITGAKFSPDGNTVYYSAAIGAEPSRLFLTRLDGTASEPLKLDPAVLLSVSRKGELAILLTNQRSPANSVGTLARVPAIGGSPRPLEENVIDADWAPDGERLAIERADGSIEFPINHRIAVGGQSPRVSPNGHHVAWIDNTSVKIAEETGHIVVDEKVWAFGLAWSPDGNEVWFTGSENESGDDRALYALSLAGRRRLIDRGPGAVTVTDVGPGGKALIYTGSGWWTNAVWRQGEPQETHLDLFGRSALKGLSADGRQMLAYQPRAVGKGAYLLSIDGKAAPRLGDEPPMGLSPKGDWMLVPDADGARLTLVPTSAGNRREVPVPPGLKPRTGQRAQWSVSGRELFVSFASANEPRGTGRVYVRSGEGAWQPVTPANVRSGPFVVSPDGAEIAMADQTGVVTLFRVDGGEPRRLDGERGEPLLWSSDGRWLFLTKSDADPLLVRIYRRHLTSGRIESWCDLTPSDRSGVYGLGTPILVADDGKVCVYPYSRVSSDLFLVHDVR